jgi:hypothetical protein
VREHDARLEFRAFSRWIGHAGRQPIRPGRGSPRA